MMFLTQISGTVLQSLRLSDTGGIIMKATIISAVSTGLLAGVFGLISVLITYYFSYKNNRWHSLFFLRNHLLFVIKSNSFF